MDWESIRNIVVSVVGLLMGGGGLAALYKARQDSKKGIRESDLAEEIAETNYMERVLQLQTEALLNPLREELLSVKSDVRGLEERIKGLEEEKFTLIRRADAYEVYIERLIDHINSGKGPPAPDRLPSLL